MTCGGLSAVVCIWGCWSRRLHAIQRMPPTPTPQCVQRYCIIIYYCMFLRVLACWGSQYDNQNSDRKPGKSRLRTSLARRHQILRRRTKSKWSSVRWCNHCGRLPQINTLINSVLMTDWSIIKRTLIIYLQKNSISRFWFPPWQWSRVREKINMICAHLTIQSSRLNRRKLVEFDFAIRLQLEQT